MAKVTEQDGARSVDIDATVDVPSIEPPINIRASCGNWGGLSNLPHSPFVIDGERFASMEAFVQYIKYPPGHASKSDIPGLFGARAKKAGAHANEVYHRQLNRNPNAELLVYWKKQQISVGSPAHVDLLARALRAKFSANPRFAQLLVSSGDRVLTHHLGNPERFTTFPAETFVDILTEIRSELQEARR